MVSTDVILEAKEGKFPAFTDAVTHIAFDLHQWLCIHMELLDMPEVLSPYGEK